MAKTEKSKKSSKGKRTKAKLDRRRLRVRRLKAGDFESVVELQLTCFPGMLPWDRDHFDSMLSRFPEGQLGIDYGGKLIASSSSLVVEFDLYSQWHNWAEIADNGYIRNHTYEGDTLYGIEVMVDPEYRGLRLARRLYDARKKLAKQLNLARIIVGGRIPRYGRVREEMTAEEYVKKVEAKELYDPVLTTQLSNGFVVKRLIPNYMPSDEESAGYATFLQWNNLDHRVEGHLHYEPVRRVRIATVQYQMRPIANFDEFATHCSFFVDSAGDYQADDLLFPELFTSQLLSCTPSHRPGLAARKLADYVSQYVELFHKLALRYNVNIIAGSIFTIEHGDLYNMAYLFRRDGTIAKQPKVHITPSEAHWWGVKPGHQLEVFETDRGRISIQICYDIEFPEMSRYAAKKGAQLVFVPFNTHDRQSYLRVRTCAMARCIENHLYVVTAGCTGNLPDAENADIHYAQSAIFTPSDVFFSRDGIAAESTPNIETILVHDLDIELLRKHRYDGTTLNWNDRRTDLYRVRYQIDGEPLDI